MTDQHLHESPFDGANSKDRDESEATVPLDESWTHRSEDALLGTSNDEAVEATMGRIFKDFAAISEELRLHGDSSGDECTTVASFLGDIDPLADVSEQTNSLFSTDSNSSIDGLRELLMDQGALEAGLTDLLMDTDEQFFLNLMVDTGDDEVSSFM